MRKIFLLVIVLSVFLRAQELKGYLHRDQAIEPIFTAAEVHAFFNDAGTYDTATNLYSGYRTVVQNLSAAQARKRGYTTTTDTILVYQCYYDSTQKLIIPDNYILLYTIPPGYQTPYLYPKYGTNGQCTIKMRCKRNAPYETYTFSVMTKP